jgi:hypothetical protein
VGYGANVSPGVSDVHEELSSGEHSKLVFSMIARSGPTIEPSAFRPPLKRRPPALGTSKLMSEDE